MLDTLYPWLKAVHLIAVIFWMAGLLYLPRLFIYHSVAQSGGELEAKMEEAEVKLHNASAGGVALWLWVKVALAFTLIGYHGFIVIVILAIVQPF